MNWYKRIKLNQRIKERALTYQDIGHSDYEGKYDNEISNIIWVYSEGDLLAREENDMTPTHTDAFPFIKGWGYLYYGRYEPDTNRVSIDTPVKGVGAYTDTPKRLLYLLNQKFNNPIIHEF